jgi:hypothetical protein
MAADADMNRLVFLDDHRPKESPGALASFTYRFVKTGVNEKNEEHAALKEVYYDGEFPYAYSGVSIRGIEELELAIAEAEAAPTVVEFFEKGVI